MTHSAGCGCPQCDTSNRIEGMTYREDDTVVKANAIKMQREIDFRRSYNPDEKFDSKAAARHSREQMKYNR